MPNISKAYGKYEQIKSLSCFFTKCLQGDPLKKKTRNTKPIEAMTKNCDMYKMNFEKNYDNKGKEIKYYIVHKPMNNMALSDFKLKATESKEN